MLYLMKPSTNITRALYKATVQGGTVMMQASPAAQNHKGYKPCVIFLMDKQNQGLGSALYARDVTEPNLKGSVNF